MLLRYLMWRDHNLNVASGFPPRSSFLFTSASFSRRRSFLSSLGIFGKTSKCRCAPLNRKKRMNEWHAGWVEMTCLKWLATSWRKIQTSHERMFISMFMFLCLILCILLQFCWLDTCSFDQWKWQYTLNGNSRFSNGNHKSEWHYGVAGI